MASQISPISEEYHSLSSDLDPENTDDDAASGSNEPPMHPTPAMQGAFEESIFESAANDGASRHPYEQDPEVRRQELLNAGQYDVSFNKRWNQRPTAQHHPLMKLLAQIIFGMHLLQQEQAKSEGEVVRILQNHVNEVDSFLERTSEDFELAIRDIAERIRFLELPMHHLDVFNVMLNERPFRTQLLEGNEKIEKIIQRTAAAMNAALLDVRIGVEANKELSQYLDSVHDRWPREQRAISDVFGAMRGNEQGWTGYLKDLQVKGKALGDSLERLGQVIARMSKLAAAASRRNRAQGVRPPSSGSASGSKSAPNSPGLRSKFAPDEMPPPMPTSPSRTSSTNKPLPREPPVIAGATQVGKGNGAHPVPMAQRFESPRQTSHYAELRKPSALSSSDATRPKTSDGPVRRKEARAADERVDTGDLLEFFKAAHTSPLGSNPPAGAAMSERKPGRTQSQGGSVFLGSTMLEKKSSPLSRSSEPDAADVPNVPQSRPLVLPAISENDKPAAYRPNGGQSPPQRSAFARRLSKRIRHMQPEQEAHESGRQMSSPEKSGQSPSSGKATSPQIDSAYASSTEKQRPHFQEPAKREPVEEKQRSQANGLSLFPKTQQPLYSTAIPEKQDPWDDRKSNGTAMSKGVSFASMRKFFHMRKSSRMWN